MPQAINESRGITPKHNRWLRLIASRTRQIEEFNQIGPGGSWIGQPPHCRQGIKVAFIRRGGQRNLFYCTDLASLMARYRDALAVTRPLPPSGLVLGRRDLFLNRL